jgi:uncharacterized protein YndB with AHSA1/START domain
MNQKPNLLLVDKALSINSPIATVFAFLSNHENYIRWFPGVVAIASHDQLPHGTVGKVYHETLKLPTGRNRTITIEVLESQPPVMFVMEADFAPLHPRTEIRLAKQSADETILTWRFLSRSQSSIARFLIRSLVKKMVVRQSGVGMRQLKIILEEPVS